MSEMKMTRQYLRDMIAYLAKVEDFTQSGQATFFDNEMAQLTVIRAYEVVGEIVKRLPDELRQQNPQINWRKLAGFRDFLSQL